MEKLIGNTPKKERKKEKKQIRKIHGEIDW